MSESVVRRIMRLNPRPDNIGSLKFFAIHRFVKKSYRIISDGAEFLKKVPGNFANENTYSLRFKSKNLKLRFAITADYCYCYCIISYARFMFDYSV